MFEHKPSETTRVRSLGLRCISHSGFSLSACLHQFHTEDVSSRNSGTVSLDFVLGRGWMEPGGGWQMCLQFQMTANYQQSIQKKKKKRSILNRQVCSPALLYMVSCVTCHQMLLFISDTLTGTERPICSISSLGGPGSTLPYSSHL